MPKADLASVPTEDLVQELKRRFEEIEKARQLLGASTASSRTAKNSRHSESAFHKWADWKQFKAEHPNATTKDYFKWRKQQKQKA